MTTTHYVYAVETCTWEAFDATSWASLKVAPDTNINGPYNEDSTGKSGWHVADGNYAGAYWLAQQWHLRFDLSGLSIPPGEVIVDADFEEWSIAGTDSPGTLYFDVDGQSQRMGSALWIGHDAWADISETAFMVTSEFAALDQAARWDGRENSYFSIAVENGYVRWWKDNQVLLGAVVLGDPIYAVVSSIAYGEGLADPNGYPGGATVGWTSWGATATGGRAVRLAITTIPAVGPAGVQPAATGALRAHHTEQHLSGNQPAGSGSASADLVFTTSRQRLVVPVGSARVTSPRPASGSIRTRRDGVL